MERKSFFKVLFGGIVGLFVTQKVTAAKIPFFHFTTAIPGERVELIGGERVELIGGVRAQILNVPIEAGLWYPKIKLWQYGTWNLMKELRDTAKEPVYLWDFRPQEIQDAFAELREPVEGRPCQRVLEKDTQDFICKYMRS